MWQKANSIEGFSLNKIFILKRGGFWAALKEGKNWAKTHFLWDQITSEENMQLHADSQSLDSN